MAANPLVSVVIPTYNRPDMLVQTLQTVYAQTLSDYEIVVVNDGSTDDTAALLQPHLARIRLINQENAGIGAARNRGIDEARGKYVATLDHDDLWLPGKLAAQVAFLEARPSCVAASVRYAYSTAPEICAFDTAQITSSDGIVARPFKALADGHVFLMSSSLMFRREKTAGLRYATHRQCIEDVPFQAGLIGRGLIGIAGAEILMVYRVHDTNYSSQASFYYNGIRLLREMQRDGAFREITGQQASDLDAYFSHIARTAAVRQLCGGYRARGWSVYFTELPHQLAAGRAQFIAAFPLLAALPKRVLARRWAGAVR